MASIIAAAERYSVNAVAAQLRVHSSTIWRWVLRGVKGRKLPTLTIGGRRWVLASALEAFLAEGNQGDLPQSDDLCRRADHAGAMLDALGVGPSRSAGLRSGGNAASKGRSNP